MKSRHLMKIDLLAFVLIGAVAISHSSCNRSLDPSPQPKEPVSQTRELLTDAQAGESHRQMLSALRELEVKSDVNNLYFNSLEMEIVLKRLQKANAIFDWVEEMKCNRDLGSIALRMGRTEESLQYYKSALDLYERVKNETAFALPPDAEQSILFALGVASLRKAEDENCVNCRTGESCILPIQGTGVHEKRSGSEDAMKYFQQTLAIDEHDTAAIWLLNIAAMTLGEYPQGVPEKFRIRKERFESEVEFPRFHNVAINMGLDTMSHAGGAIADDFDGDNLIDIFVSDWNPRGQARFFHNNGDGSFSDQTEAANLSGITGGLNTVQCDFDNDGDLDVFILRGAWLEGDRGLYPNSLLQNDGKAKFTDVTFAAGLAEKNYPTQNACWADYDNDGDLDCFVGNEDFPSQLFQNDGSGFFMDVAEKAGVTNDRFAKGSNWGDFDGDRYPDLYVSNLGDDNRLYHNNGDGTFTDVTVKLGVVGPQMSFATWFWDFNNDGILDIFVGSYKVGVEYLGLEYIGVGSDTETDCLYQGTDDGRFINVTKQQGLVKESQPMGCNFGDLDNDGYLDFYLGTGYPNYEGLMPNVMYRNNAGESFSDVTFAGGFGHLQKGHGVAFADFDHDGDQDIFVEMGGAFAGDAFQNALFENPGFENNWIKIKLTGKTSNRCGVGARIKVTIDEAGKQREIYRWVTNGSSFGANPYRQEIGVGKAEIINSIEVYWPTSSTTQRFDDIEINQQVEIREAENEYQKVPLKTAHFTSAQTD